MATLADAFLADLEDLSDASEGEEEPRQEAADEQARHSVCSSSPCSPLSLFAALSAGGRRSLPLQAAAQIISAYKGAWLPCCCSQLLSWLIIPARPWQAVSWQCRWRKMKLGCPALTTWMRWRICSRVTGIILSCWCVLAHFEAMPLTHQICAAWTTTLLQPSQVPMEFCPQQGAKMWVQHQCRGAKEVGL